MKIIGSHTFSRSDATTYNLTFEYAYAEQWLLGTVLLKKTGGTTQIEGLHVTMRPQSAAQTHAFTLRGKGPLHYALLVLAIVIPAFIVITIVTCIRAPIRRKKWFWILFILCGFGGVVLDWTSGQWRLNPLSVHLLGEGFFPYGPFMLQVGVPVGAILFWIRRRRLAAPVALAVEARS